MAYNPPNQPLYVSTLVDYSDGPAVQTVGYTFGQQPFGNLSIASLGGFTCNPGSYITGVVGRKGAILDELCFICSYPSVATGGGAACHATLLVRLPAHQAALACVRRTNANAASQQQLTAQLARSGNLACSAAFVAYPERSCIVCYIGVRRRLNNMPHADRLHRGGHQSERY